MKIENKTGNRFLSRKDSVMLHGAAILMMIYHHLFITGNNWCLNFGKSVFDPLDVINFGDAPTAQMSIARFCKICVAVFAFTSGYAMFVQFSRKTEKETDFKEMYGYCLKRLLSFYKQFILCFLFFTGYEYLTGNHDGFDFSLTNYLINLLGLRSSYNATWWYVAVYYIMILIAPILYFFLNRFKFRQLIVVALSAVVLGAGAYLSFAYLSGNPSRWLHIASNLLQSVWMIYPIIFAEGMASVKYKITEFIDSKLNVWISVAVLLVIMAVRILLIRVPGDFVFDVILIIPFVVCLKKLLNCSDRIASFFRFFGKYSAYMWYCHPYFYSYLFFRLVQRSDISFLVYLQVTVYTLIASLIFSMVEQLLDKTIHKVLKDHK